MKEETNEFRQLLISGMLGDGCLIKSGAMSFSCMHEEYMLLKQQLARGVASAVTTVPNRGFKQDAVISKVAAGVTPFGKKLYGMSLADAVDQLDELGLALWIFDDGSLHKKSYFYNINTHSFSLEDQENILIPLLNKFNIFPKIMPERKKDGRVFNYLYVGKFDGADVISDLLSKIPLKCYSYKVWHKEYSRIFKEINNLHPSLTKYAKSKLINSQFKKFKELEETSK